MKKIFIIALIIGLTVSCDVMDVEPSSSILASEAFNDKEGIEKGILGAYSTFQSYSYYARTHVIFPDLASDNLDHPNEATAVTYAEVDGNSILPENGNVSGIWSTLYDGINIANNVIVKVPGISDMTENEKNIALAELYFIRALNHFNLLNYFGEIPIKTKPTVGTNNLDVGRDPVDAVYNQIITDLTFAADYLPASGNKIRASKYAAKALLARVYLYKHDYSQAIIMATDVIKNGGYILLDNYSDIFSQDQSLESIFEVYFSKEDRNRIAEYNFPKTLNGRREVEPSQSLLDDYESDDDRFAASIAFEGSLAYAIKYDDLSLGADNVIVLRIAEMYLIRAEAEAELEGNITSIQNDINKIRTRANLGIISTDTYPELLNIIEQERRIEFAFEGYRWFDLVRTGRAVEILPNVTSINQTLFPIPADEINTNKNPNMTQNPGY